MTRLTRFAIGALVLPALMLTACRSGTPAPPVAHLAASSPASASAASALHLLGQCLRQHGLANFPDPAVASDGPAAGRPILDKSVLKGYQPAVVDQAMNACASALQQSGITNGSGSSVSSEEIEQRLALARCIRAHGVPNFPDPNSTTGDVTPPPGLTKTSPSIIAAIRACPSQAQAAGISVPSNSP